MTVTLWSGVVPVDAIDIIAARVDRLYRRAIAKGFPPPHINLGARTFVSDGSASTEWISVAIEADGPLALGDYQFVGVVAQLGDGTPFVTYAPGMDTRQVEVAPDYVDYCDHCETVRYRRDTYLVRAATGGATLQVGSTCIKDFTGHNPAAIVSWLRAVADLTISDLEISGWGRSAARFYPIEDIIRKSARIASKTGYVSKQKSEDEGKTSTAELVRGWLSATGVALREYEGDFPASDASEKLLSDTMVAVPNSTGVSEWANDIYRLVAAGSVQWRHVGIAASAVILGMRKVEREASEGRPASHYVGEVGQRLEFSGVTVTMIRGYENAYGQSYVVRMSVNESDDLLWFASGSSVDTMKEGDTITLVGTVKGHEVDSRSNRETTVLTRCKVKE